MKKLLVILFSLPTLAATTTAKPFKLNFFLNSKNVEVVAKLKQSCRYEKIVWSDSSQYEAEWKEIPLKVETVAAAGMTEVTVSLNSTKSMSVTGIFKPTKGCYSNVEISFVDTKYSIGWANRFDKAIQFDLRTKQFYKEDNSYLNVSVLREKLEGKELKFEYKDVKSQYNIFLYFDGERDWDVFAVTAARNPKTGKPFRLKK